MMRLEESSSPRVLQDRTFLLLIVTVSFAFGWILWPFYGAVFWAVVFAILFTPLYRKLLSYMRGKRTLAALATLTIVLTIVILPSALIAAMLAHEAVTLYQRVQSGELSFGRYVQQALGVIPAWLTGLLDRFGLTSLSEVQERFSAGLTKGIQFAATQALNIGQNTFQFVISLFIMLYLLFFLIRDGDAVVRNVKEATPLPAYVQRDLLGKFATVIRATVKGNIVVAIVQGALGGMIFWVLGIPAALLWAVLMAFLSLLPAVGAALVWLPVAMFFLLTGDVWQGVVLIVFGMLVISVADNVLRPMLVGKDTKMPDYLVLISTLGGMAIFGFNGFVIGPTIAAMFIAVWATVAALPDEPLP